MYSGLAMYMLRPPTSHFYGIRDYVAVDPDGHQLVFFSRVEVTDEIAPVPRRKRRKSATPVESEVLVEPASEPELVPQSAGVPERWVRARRAILDYPVRASQGCRFAAAPLALTGPCP